MKYNTRFCPTVNGPLHLGHLYTILVNRAEAHRTGGKFILRYDDTQLGWCYFLSPETIAQYKADMLADLEWLGIVPDQVDSQVDMMPKVENLLRDIFHYQPAPEQLGPGPGPTLTGCEHHFYPYTERLTCEKVIMDMLEGITYLIRGVDLISEDNLYHHFCSKLNLWHPITVYLPRLNCGAEISKTLGNFQLHTYREAHYSPDELLCKLAGDCLTDGGWFCENIRPAPKLSAWASEV